MPATNVRVAYRPARVGFLLRADSLDDVHTAARLATLLWGGVYDPLIAVDDVEKASQLVARFRPDVLHAVAADETLDAVIAAHPHLGWPHALEYFNGRLTSHEGELPFLDVRPAISAIYSDLRQARASPWLRPTWADGEEAPLYSVLFGDYGLEDYVDWFVRGLHAGQIDIVQLPPGVDWTRTPLGVTAFALEPPFPPGGLTSDGVVLGDPASAADLALFWNLRAGGLDLAFWPREDVGNLQATAALRVTQLVARPAREPEPGFYLWSTTPWPQQSELPEALARALGEHERVLAHLNWDTFRQPLHLPQPVAADETSVLGVLEDDGYANARLSVPLPPSPFQGVEPELFQERLLTRMSLLVDSDQGHTLRLPYLPDLNDWYDREVTVVGDGARVEVSALSVFTRPRDSSLSLRLPERADVVRRVFARAGVTATPSAAGRAVDVVGAQLRGLQGARVLRAPGVRELLRTPKWRNWETALGTIARGGLPDQRNQTASDVLAALLERGALVAGLKLQCPNCRVRERYALDQLGEAMRCPRCRNTFAPTPRLQDSIWEYAASGFFADEGAHGAVPVLLTMMRLAQDTSIDRFIVSNHDLRADRVDCESDLLVLEQHHDGRLAVAVSECKDAGEIDQQDIENLAAVAERMHASGVECYLIFTTLRDEFTPAELDRFRAYREQLDGQWSHDTSAFESWPRPAPVLYTPRELGQWQVYPVGDRDGLPHEHLLGLRELAANSAARYLD
jgi:hypothetical protein